MSLTDLRPDGDGGGGGGGGGDIDRQFYSSGIGTVGLSAKAIVGQFAALFGVYDVSDVLLAGFEVDGDLFAPNVISRYNTVGEFDLNTFYDEAVKYDINGDLVIFDGTAKEFLLGNELLQMMSSGVETFDGLSIDGGAATFGVGALEGHIVPNTSSYTSVVTTATTGNVPATASGVSYIYMNAASAVVAQTAAPIPDDFRDKIYLGRVVTVGGVIVAVQDEPAVLAQGTSQIYDFARAIGLFSISGNLVAPNGANLNVDYSGGDIFNIGANFTTNPDNPHYRTFAAAVAASFAYIRQTAGSTGAATALVDPLNYDNAGTLTAITGSNNRATVQRVYLFSSGSIRIQYGQTVYPTLSAAIAAISTEAFIQNPAIKGNGILIASIAVTKGCTDLTLTSDALILTADRFGSASFGSSGIPTTNLQQSYDNSVSPEITLDSTRNGVSIRDNATPIGAGVNLLEVLDNTLATEYFAVDDTGITAGTNNNIFNADRLQGRDVAGAAPANGEVLTWDSGGAAWTPAVAGGGGGGGDVTGPVSATDNAIVRFDGVTGKVIQDYTSSPPTITDTGVASFADATHAQSERIGDASTVGGVRATAFGYNAGADASDATALGWGSGGTAIRSVCVGRSSSVSSTGISSIAIGYISTASGQSAISIGSTSGALGLRAVAIGETSSADGAESFAMGYQATADITNAIAIGGRSTASGSAATTVGYNSLASGNYSLALGNTATANNTLTVALGGLNPVNTSDRQMVVGGSIGGIFEYWFGTTNGRLSSGAFTKNFTFNFPSASGTDVAAPLDFELNAQAGTGTGDGGSLLFRTADAGTTGSTVNTHTTHLEITGDGNVIMPTLPTSSAGLPTGALWNNAGVINIV